MTRFAGVDGCPAGWAVVTTGPGASDPRFDLAHDFAAVLALAADILAVDMPIGLPDHIGPDGRGPERAARRHLGERQSSIFAVPSRSAVMETDYRAGCAIAQATSTPPRQVSKQCFHLFPKMREIDAVMTPDLESRVYESHPELAFWRLNGEQAMRLPKKVKSRPNPAGIEQRRELLRRHGYSDAFLAMRLPARVGPDDFIDAAVLALIAERIGVGTAESFPPHPERDGKGLRMAMWA